MSDQEKINNQREYLSLQDREIENLKEIRGVIQGNISELTGKAKAYADGTRAARGLQSISEKLLQDARGEVELNEKQLQQLRDKADLARQALAEDSKNLDLTEEQRNSFKDILSESEELIGIAEKRLKLEKDIVEA